MTWHYTCGAYAWAFSQPSSCLKGFVILLKWIIQNLKYWVLSWLQRCSEVFLRKNKVSKGKKEEKNGKERKQFYDSSFIFINANLMKCPCISDSAPPSGGCPFKLPPYQMSIRSKNSTRPPYETPLPHPPIPPQLVWISKASSQYRPGQWPTTAQKLGTFTSAWNNY